MIIYRARKINMKKESNRQRATTNEAINSNIQQQADLINNLKD